MSKELNGFLKNPIIFDDMKSIFSSVADVERLKNRSVLITGANGMIASYLVMFFVFLNETEEYDIELFLEVRSREKSIERFGDYCSRGYFHIIEQDVNDPLNYEYEFDYIIHAASLASPQYYGSYPVETMLPNIIGTFELLNYARRHPPKTFLFFSSGAVYGKLDAAKPINENDQGILHFLENGSMYALSKQTGEALCKAFCQEYGLPTKAVRIFHSYGPTMDYKNDKRSFSEFVNNIINGEDIELKSPGRENRAFCYMADVLTAILFVILDGESGECYNIANDDQFMRIRDLADSLADLFSNRGISVFYKNRDDKDYSSSRDSQSCPPDTSRLRKLGWSPKTDVKDGFARTIEAICFREV